jgi:hypothetical protein
MPRRLEWVQNEKFQGFACSECDWKFIPAGPLPDTSFDEMKRKYESERDKEFAAHTCKTPKPPRDN